MGNLAYEEENAFELLNGKIVSMSPRPAINHNIVVVNISTLFKNYLKGKNCIPFSDGVDVFLTENDRVMPDDIYSIYPDYLLKKMTDEEKEQIRNDFTTTLYPDLVISLSDVFDKLLI